MAKARYVRKKALNELLQDPQWTLDEGYMRRCAALSIPDPIYVHPDGRVLNVFPEHYVTRGGLYPTREEFELLLGGMEANYFKGPRHILQDRLPYGQDFVEHVPALVDELAVLFNIPRAELDNSMESLNKLQPKVRRRGYRNCLEAPIFPALVAYLGEVMRQQVNGQWLMRPPWQVPDIWEPYIVDPQGRECNSWSQLYDIFAENEYGLDIPSMAAVEIASRQAPTPLSAGTSGAVLIFTQPSED